MSDFWVSELGVLSGSAEDAFSKTFKQVPDNTMALAKIVSFKNENFDGQRYLKVDWLLTAGDFKGQHVFQKLHVFDTDPKKRHRSLNMFMLMYKLFGLSPESKEAPVDSDLAIFESKFAGIKIQETAPNDKGRQYNWVSEVWPAQGFECVTGESPVVHKTHGVDSALTRNSRNGSLDIDLDLPF